MNSRTSLVIIASCLLIACNIPVLAFDIPASELPVRTLDGRIIHGGNTRLNKASGDTIDLMGPTGSGAFYSGDFESGWGGWTSRDVTQTAVTHWQISDYNQSVANNFAAWCGDITIATCNDSLDPVGGYGNSWHDIMSYRTAVADPGESATVTVTATLQIDTEIAYDFVHLSTKLQGNLTFTDIMSWDGTSTEIVNTSTTILPAELIDSTDVHLQFRFTSDGGWSDVDCSFQGAGACQIDDITVTITQPGQADIVSFTDFQDGLFGDWFVEIPSGVGDFAALWSGLSDLDPCATNLSQQVAFIDDGVVVPGTGGSRCISWCYGPGGYIVNTTGGLAGPNAHIEIDVESPVMTWPANDYEGIDFRFDVYRHEQLGIDSPGITYSWAIRSADTDNSAGNGAQVIADQRYHHRSFSNFGGPDYLRAGGDVSDLINPGRDLVQVSLGIWELGWAWGFSGNNGTPAPYFDNVSIKVFPYTSPGMAMREMDMINDNFPESDVIDTSDPGSMHVRFDMANNISLASHLHNDPGDSMVMTIVPLRAGATFVGPPEMHYAIDANPVFDGVRTTATSGVVLGRPAVGASGPVSGRFAFDLPDTGTLFPGDVLHYYIRAGDDLDGDVQYATVPADLIGFGVFENPLSYNSTFVVHALPSIRAAGSGAFAQPEVLFWNDFGNRGGEAAWYSAFANIGLQAGRDFDIYYTNAPSSGVGNGLGGRTSGSSLTGYEDVVYTSGNLGISTLSNGDFYFGGGNDIGALTFWLSTGNKDIFLTGDDLASDLALSANVPGTTFLTDIMGLNVVSEDIRNLINNQAAPLVFATAGNPVFQNVTEWIAYGSCAEINWFDAVTALPGAMRLAEFGDPYGNAGTYSFSAATLNTYNLTNRVISLPYDLMYIYTPSGAKADAPLAARAQVLADVLDFFGGTGSGVPSHVPAKASFAVSHFPNPFNPITNISYIIAGPGHLTLKVYNVRGELVKTLIDGHVSTSGTVRWDGTGNRGRIMSSGVYFYEARMGAEVQIAKMTIVK